MTRHLTPLRLCVACVVLLAANAAMSACSSKDDGVTPRDCADRDNAEVCAP